MRVPKAIHFARGLSAVTLAAAIMAFATVPLAADDAAHRAVQERCPVTVDEHKLGRPPGPPAQGPDRPCHRQQRRLQDIDGVDLGDVRLADADPGMRFQHHQKLGPPRRFQLLGIVEPMAEIRGKRFAIEDHGPRHHGPATTAPARLPGACTH